MIPFVSFGLQVICRRIFCKFSNLSMLASRSVGLLLAERSRPQLKRIFQLSVLYFVFFVFCASASSSFAQYLVFVILLGILACFLFVFCFFYYFLKCSRQICLQVNAIVFYSFSLACFFLPPSKKEYSNLKVLEHVDYVFL